MRKRTLKRFGAVLCAFAICLFSVFGVSSLFSKKDNNVISASAEEVQYKYSVTVPAGSVFEKLSSSGNGWYPYGVVCAYFVSLNSSNGIGVYSSVDLCYFSSNSEVDTLGLRRVSVNPDRDTFLEDFTFVFYGNTFFSLLEFDLNNQCVLDSSSTIDWLFRFSNLLQISNVGPHGFDKSSGYSFVVNREFLEGYTQEDLDNARESGYNSGYALGQMFGKAEGEIIGQNNAGVNSSELFAGVKANLYVRSGEDLISSGLNVDVSQVVDEFYPNLPFWQFQITDGVISKDSTSTYVLELILPIYIKYPSNTLYLGAGANATGVVGRVTGVSGYLYPQKQNFDGGVVTAPLPAGFESFYNIKSVAFTNPPTEDYYLSSVMISFTANPVRDSSFLLTLTTQELLNDYINTFNESYSTGEKVGYNEGKTVGYNEGVEDAHTYTFLNLMVAVIDAPIKSFTGMLDFEILGMNMQEFFLSLLTSALVLAAYRLFSGGKA